MSASLKDKSVVVTGASKGIGKGIAKVFGSFGAKVLITARGEAEGLQAVKEITEAGGTAAFFAADVTSVSSLQAMAAKAEELYGGIDVLCANAGVFPAMKLADMTEQAWDDIFAINVKGMAFSIQACLPALKKSEAGRVVITSSITGPITGFPGWSHYGATKAAQLGFLRTAAIELSRDKITVNAVLPGNIITEGILAMGQEYIDSMAASIPLGKLGIVEDIGYAAAFLASKEAGYITGQTITVDGGQILPESLAALSA